MYNNFVEDTSIAGGVEWGGGRVGELAELDSCK